MDNDLIKLLEEAGFTDKEARVYLALLELGKGNVTEISKISNLKRAIIYVILEGLVKRGYVSELPERKINTYQATDPSVILGQLRGITKNFSQMLPILRTLGNRGSKKPKIRYYDSEEGILRIWDGEMNVAKEAFFISSYQRIEERFPGKIDEWIKKAEKGIVTTGFRHLVSDNPYELELVNKFRAVDQNVRILSELKNSHMDFTIYDNKLAITSLEENAFIVVIESDELVRSMRPLFELAWERGREMKNSQKALKNKGGDDRMET